VSTILARYCKQLRNPLIFNADLVTGALWLILALWGWLSLSPMWIAAMKPSQNQITDFYQDWGSARNYWTGLPTYTPHAISIPRHLNHSSNSMPSIEYNAHPPTCVLLTLPLAWVDYPAAVLACNVISFLALALSLVIIAHELHLPPKVLLPTLALLPLCQPIYANFQLGQLTSVIGLLIALTWVLERSKRMEQSCLAGALVGIAAAIKLFPAYVVVYYLAQLRIRPILAATLIFMVLNTLAVLVLGIDTYHDYINIVLPYQSKFRSFGYNISIAGFWYKLFDPLGERNLIIPLWHCPVLAHTGTLLSDLAITLAVIKISSQALTVTQRDFAFAAVVTAMLLVSPVTWDFSLPLLLVPLALLGQHSLKPYASWMLGPLILISIAIWIPQILLTKLALAGRSVIYVPWTFMLGAPSLKFYALLATFALTIVACWVEKKSTSIATTHEVEGLSKIY
jgi:alpha-1,2-mannosyltransferase